MIRTILLSTGATFCIAVVGGGFFYLHTTLVTLRTELTHVTSSLSKVVNKPKPVSTVPPVPLVAHGSLPEASKWLRVQKKVNNTVVQVISETSQFNWFEPYKTPTQSKGVGSGFFISDTGEIVTNYHVVAQARKVLIRLPKLGQEQFEVELVGASPRRDIALLRVKEQELTTLKQALGGQIPCAELGDSDSVQRAQDVMALGYPLNQPSLKSTIGNVSGRERVMHQYYIQITAPLNPGNSGGPSIDASGKVIGVNSRGILAAQNVGYIIPINDVKNTLKDLHKMRFLRKPNLGCIFTPSTATMVSYLGNPEPGGWYISRVFKGTVLDKAGIQDGDMLYQVNGYQVDRFGDINVAWSEDKVSLMDLLNRLVVGDQIDMVVYRRGQKKKFSFKLEAEFLLPVRTQYPDFEKIDYEVIGGMVLMNLSLNHVTFMLDRVPQLSPTLAKYLLPENRYDKAVIITNILPDSPAKNAIVLSSGSLIGEVNGQSVRDLKEFRAALLKSKESGFITVTTRDENRLAVLPLAKVLHEEERLSKLYFYPQSGLISALR